MDVEDYCRNLEAYLCRKNEGHLIRIVGPAFDQVCGWAAQGIPYSVACRGVDRYFERYYSKGSRRRPVRIEFCEADVFDVFDEWRRAVGIAGGGQDPPRRGPSLPEHLERVIAQLTTRRSGTDQELDAMLDRIIRELDTWRARAGSVRGAGREEFLQRLAAMDAELLTAFRTRYSHDEAEAMGLEADVELAPFRDRMPPDVYLQAKAACVDRLIRERARLPVIALE